MKVKCYYCDKDGTKTLDKEKHDYVKKNNKNYHTKCYIEKLKKKNVSEDDIQKEVKQIKEKMAAHKKEIELRNKPKNNFCYWIMDYYNIDVIPSGFFHRLAELTTGRHPRIKVAISYEELFDIYQYMAKYLNKVALSKVDGFDNVTGRLYWDLAIVINNYNDYKKWKEKQKQTSIEKEQIEKLIKRDKMLKNKIIKNNTNEFNILDDINDLLL